MRASSREDKSTNGVRCVCGNCKGGRQRVHSAYRTVRMERKRLHCGKTNKTHSTPRSFIRKTKTGKILNKIHLDTQHHRTAKTNKASLVSRLTTLPEARTKRQVNCSSNHQSKTKQQQKENEHNSVEHEEVLDRLSETQNVSRVAKVSQGALVNVTKKINTSFGSFQCERRPRFYWECRNDQFMYNPDRRHLVYFCGCFSPPHRGHYSVVEDAIRALDTNKIFIHQIGDEQRHGVPFSLSQRIFKEYIRQLLPADRVQLTPQVSLSQLYRHAWIDEVDTIVVVRGNEQVQHADPGQIKRIEDKACRWFSKCTRLFQAKGKEVVFLYPERPLVQVLSATKFVEALQKYRFAPWERKYQKLQAFLPANLPESSALKIIRALDQCSLK